MKNKKKTPQRPSDEAVQYAMKLAQSLGLQILTAR